MNWRFQNHRVETQSFLYFRCQLKSFDLLNKVRKKKREIQFSSVPINHQKTPNFPNSASTFLSSLQHYQIEKAKISSPSYHNSSSSKGQSYISTKQTKFPTFRNKTPTFTVIPRNKLKCIFPSLIV